MAAPTIITIYLIPSPYYLLLFYLNNYFVKTFHLLTGQAYVIV